MYRDRKAGGEVVVMLLVEMERCVQIGRWAQVSSYVNRSGKLCAGRKVGKSNYASRRDVQVGRGK